MYQRARRNDAHPGLPPVAAALPSGFRRSASHAPIATLFGLGTLILPTIMLAGLVLFFAGYLFSEGIQDLASAAVDQLS